MARIYFEPDRFAVMCGPERMMLLKKEFELLKFLYENESRAFTREQLLDRVWPLEYPVERTVDDHIYRLRKKLKRWPSLDINTVRGYGYSLTIKERQAPLNPSLHDAELNENMRLMLKKYHLFGQGKSMLALASQQDELGFKLDPFYRIYIRFLQGDIAWFLDTDEFPIAQRLYGMLLLFRVTARESGRCLELYEQALESGLLSAEQHREMLILNVLDLYAECGRTDIAIERLELTRRTIEADRLHGFTMPAAIAEMYVHLLAGNGESADRLADTIEGMLGEAPYLREIGQYRVVKGLRLLGMGQRAEAAEMLGDGLDMLGMAGNAPLQLWSVQQILNFLTYYANEETLLRKYTLVYADLDREYGLEKHRDRLEAMIVQCLQGGEQGRALQV
ncbi:winged helix-turn-helix domain-containing protein [Paenibacillus beijingensis]|uniref:Chemotaxis protein CheY n=1 Tax=Paenibacillus beijingensis TaxID=1126833 RepID=A0A0D5NQY3_9BACL|nr:winged helix-turn-helix domain-containing protein [Paenibacillus beijingensis]AJY77313.1 chemotaxis protein CheY [Paenibacillus beijingensis]